MWNILKLLLSAVWEVLIFSSSQVLILGVWEVLILHNLSATPLPLETQPMRV